jgi:hypothetical protein
VPHTFFLDKLILRVEDKSIMENKKVKSPRDLF